MEFQQFVSGAPYVAAVLVVGVFLWRVFVRMFAAMESRFDDRFREIDNRFQQIDNRFQQIDNRFQQIDGRFQQMESRFEGRFQQMESRFDGRFVSLETRFESLDKKVDGLAADHHRLSRELSEFRGEMRSRMSMLVPRDADEA